MTETEIIEMAKKCGIDVSQDTLCRYEGWEEMTYLLIYLAIVSVILMFNRGANK